MTDGTPRDLGGAGHPGFAVHMDVAKNRDTSALCFSFCDRAGTLHLLDIVECGVACAAKGCTFRFPQGGAHRLFCMSHWPRLPAWMRSRLKSTSWTADDVVLARNILGSLDAGNIYGAALDVARSFGGISEFDLRSGLNLSRRQAATLVDQLIAAGVVAELEDDSGQHPILSSS